MSAMTKDEFDNLHPAIREILDFFAFDHLPPHLGAVSEPFAHLAEQIALRSLDDRSRGAETTVALRKLLESKDAAVRAVLPIRGW